MAYDGFYGALSTRGAVNEYFNQANAAKVEITLLAAAVKLDAKRSADSALLAQDYAYQAQTYISGINASVLNAQAAANLAELSSQASATYAQQSLANSASALNVANAANAKSDTASSTATSALNVANGINAKADNALATSQEAFGRAANALSTALGVDNKAQTALNNSQSAVDAVALKAPIASPTFTGTPTAPKPASSSSSLQVATTSFVKDFSPAPDYISGLFVNCYDGVNLTVSPGACYIPSTGTIQRFDSTMSLTVSGTTQMTWYHLYVYTSGTNSGTLELLTTAPVSYFGTARQLTGNTSRRYLGSFRANPTGGLWPFSMDTSDRVNYLVLWSTTGFRVLSSGTSTTRAFILADAVCPITATSAVVAATSTQVSTGFVFTLSRGGSPMDAGPTVQPNGKFVATIPLDSSQRMSYNWGAAPTNGGSAFVDIGGFEYAR